MTKFSKGVLASRTARSPSKQRSKSPRSPPHVVRRGDDDERVLPWRDARRGPAARAVGVGPKAAHPRLAAEPVRAHPALGPSVGDDERRRDAAAPEPDALVETVLLAPGEHDDRVGAGGRRILVRKDEEVGGGRGERGDDAEQDELEWLMARSTASSSSGLSATDGRP